MSSVLNLYQDIGASPRRFIEQWKEEYKAPVVGYLPYYVPQEIIHAAGILPVGMWGGQVEIAQANSYLQVFACSLVRAVLELRLKNAYQVIAGVIFPSACDHLQELSDIWKTAFANDRVFDLLYPVHRGSKGAVVYLLRLFEELKVWLEEIGQKKITNEALQNAIQLYNEKRSLLRQFASLRSQRPGIISAKEAAIVIKAGLFLPVEKYIQTLRLLLAELEERQSIIRGPKIIITGIMAEPMGLLKIIDELGGVVISDDLLLGERLYRYDVQLNGHPLEALVRHYLGLEPCAILYDPKKPRGEFLVNLAQHTKADGVLVINMKYCEMEEFDYPYIKEDLEQAGIPHLWVEVEQQGVSFEQFRTRLQAFLEMLKARA